MKTTVLIADEDAGQARYLTAILKAAGHEVVTAGDAATALARLEDGRRLGIGVVLLDLGLPGKDGLGLISAIREGWRGIPVIVLTTDGSAGRAVEAMRAGAADFLTKPCAPERLEISIRNALELSRLSGEVRWLTRVGTNHLEFSDIVAGSPAICEAVALARRAARSDLAVIIEGESGTGKETFARAIHGAGERAGRPFVAVNCGAVPADAIGPVLFGRRKSDAPGKLAQAAGGTLFLDDVDELPADAQAELVRAIEGIAGPEGLRLISASQRDLTALTRSGRFRDDLFYRINAFPLSLPPLRERKNEIPDLARRFLDRHIARGDTAVEGFTTAALEMLTAAPWPGNVRELETAVQRAALMADGSLVGPQDLRGLTAPPTGDGESDGAGTPGIAALEDKPATAEPPRSRILIGEDGHIRRLFDIERDAIALALRLYNGRMSETARRLGIGRSTLYRKIDDLQLNKYAL